LPVAGNNQIKVATEAQKKRASLFVVASVAGKATVTSWQAAAAGDGDYVIDPDDDDDDNNDDDDAARDISGGGATGHQCRPRCQRRNKGDVSSITICDTRGRKMDNHTKRGREGRLLSSTLRCC
jgi:hypothetical protein